MKLTYPKPPTLDSLSLEKGSDDDIGLSSISLTASDRTAELASAQERYNNDTPPKKRYHRRPQLIEDQDANLFSLIWQLLTPASIDRLTRDFLEEYSRTSSPNPSGVALFELLLKSHKPTDQAAMLS